MIITDTWTDLIGTRLMEAAVTRNLIASSQVHYVYVLARADGAPFYVGKGMGNRVFHHEAEARTTSRLTHKLNVIRAMTTRGEMVRYCIESTHPDETTALGRERTLIAQFGRHDLGNGPLTNQTDGGEGAANPSEASRELRRQTLWGDDATDEERRIANRFFQSLCRVASVPIKPLSKFVAERLHANRASLAMTPRQAAALAASAIMNRILITEGAFIPRLLDVDGVPTAIENGVGRDILSSGMARLSDITCGRETFALTRAGSRYILRQLDRKVLIDAGVVVPS